MICVNRRKESRIGVTFSSNADTSWEPPAEPREATGLESRAQELFQLHGQSLRAYVRHIVKDAAASDDLAQETFVRLIRHMRSGTAISNVQAWLCAVGRNLAADYLREQARYASIEEAPGHSRRSEQADPTPSAEQRCLEAERAVRVERALKRLSPLELQCLQMRSAGMLYRQIGSSLGVTVSTVESALARAIRKIMTEAC